MSNEVIDPPAVAAGSQAPSDGATPADLVARAAQLIPELVERQAETERRTRYAPEMHEVFKETGLYRTLIPRRYGGYEYDLRTFSEIVKNLSRGCPSTGWGFCLAARHVVQLASVFPQSAQDAVLSADFLAAEVAAPAGTIRKVDGGWEVHGFHQYASGSPYSTHYMGQAFPVEDGSDRPTGPPALFVAPRDTWELLDDWGWSLGLRGSGSNSARFDGAVIPDDHVLLNTLCTDIDVSGGTYGLELHGNPLYAGRTLGPVALDLAALIVGMALGALDEYEVLLKTKKTVRPPVVLRAEDHQFQRWAGQARSKLAAAEALISEGIGLHMEAARAQAAGEREFTIQVDLEHTVLGREAIKLAWNAMQEIIFRTAGSSATRDGERMQRIWRDMSTAWTHMFNVQSDVIDENLAKFRLGAGAEVTLRDSVLGGTNAKGA